MADAQMLLEAFGNRVSRRHRHLRRSLRQADTDCFRVYDRDIPEMAFVLDVYGPRALLQQYARSEEEVVPGWLDAVALRTAEVLDMAPEAVTRRLRLKVDRRVEQHEKLARERREFEVREGGLRFLVDLDRYLDTGLFLDHRPLRRQIRECAAGRRFLNLFSYTGSFTVHAAAGGAVASTSVDLSNTYLEWAARNLALNALGGPQHQMVRADVRAWLAEARGREERFDLIVADPPAFSSSKMMQGVFDVQRDHRALLLGCAGVLAEDGELYFSTNLRGFVFEANMPGYLVEDISQKTIPEDFRNRSVHRCWRIRRG
jgi:23S rRNA (cytosine1962-C5)-methyltransferase